MENIKIIRSDMIDDPVVPMRVELDKDKLWELAESIKAQGLINPITVRPVVIHTPLCVSSNAGPESNNHFFCTKKYEVVAGHRRFAACKIAGMVEITCVVRDLNDQQVFEVMAAENLERQDIDPVEEAIFISRLLEKKGATATDVARRLNRSVQWVDDRLDILGYPDYMLVSLATGELKIGVAKYLGAIGDDVYRKQFVDSAIKNGMSVLQAKLLLSQWELGVLRPTTDFMSEDMPLADPERYRARAICEKCGTIAIEPNLKAVFIHGDCPIVSDDHMQGVGGMAAGSVS